MKKVFTQFIITIIFLNICVYASGIDKTFIKPDNAPWWGKILYKYYNYKGYSKSYALIIGISRYENQRYLATENDPIKMKNYLIDEAGFDYVYVLTQDEVTRSKVNRLMSVTFPNLLEEDDRFLFYWSGHGKTRNLPRGGVMGYLPLAKGNNFDSMISMNDIKEWDKLLEAKQTLYLLDSCFSGLAGKTPQNSVRKQTIKQLAKPSRQLLTAGTSKESTYVLNDQQSSIFTIALLKGLRGGADSESGGFKKDGLISVNELESYIRNYIAHNLKDRTVTPQLSELGRWGDNDGDFFFFSITKQLEQQEVRRQPSYTNITPQSSGTKKKQKKTEKVYFFEPQMVNILKGTFMMGSENGDSDEKPVHKVAIDYDFEIGKYEVTFDEYDYFCERTGRKKPSDKGWGREKRPVINVSWKDAKDYANWLSEKTGKIYRLPTEAEWEYVARAGTKTKWSFGDDKDNLKSYAWFRDNANKTTYKAGTKKANQWGVYDMHGNVWEWCEDWYVNNYNNVSNNGSANNKGKKEFRVLRGGSWVNDAIDTRSSGRNLVQSS